MKRGRERSRRRSSGGITGRLYRMAIGVLVLAAQGCGDVSQPDKAGGPTSGVGLAREEDAPSGETGPDSLNQASPQPTVDTSLAATPSSPPEGPRPTWLILVCVDDDGQPVVPSSAKLLMSSWGHTSQLDLEIEGNTIGLRLDWSWLEEAYPPSRVQHHQRGHILLKASGRVPLRSDPIFWLGSRQPPSGQRLDRTEVGFPGQEPAVLSEGMEETLAVVFRRPGSRYLKVVDPQGQPVRGVEVKSEIFWTHENHCCFPVAVEELGRNVTDTEGRVPLVDGDFEYGFELSKAHWSLVDATSCYPDRIEAVLDSEETVIQMRPHEARRLELVVMAGEKPAAGRQLLAELAPWRCGVIDGVLDTTDADGRISRDEFYPDEWATLWFEDEQQRRIWSAAPGDLTGPAPITVQLGDSGL